MTKNKKMGKKKSKTGTIVAIYGHELYRTDNYEKCGAGWLQVRYQNRLKLSVNALLVA